MKNSLLTMFTNGISSVVQKFHQMENPSLYRVEFMLISMVFAFLIFLLINLKSKMAKKEVFNKKIHTEKQKNVVKTFQNLALNLGLVSGVLNCFANFSILFLANTENASVLFPILSVLNTIGACLVGRLFFKEKLSPLQFTSIMLGIISVVLLKI